MSGSLLIAEPKTYSHWWTFVPVIPSGRQDPHYLTLKRQWADHTMNCLSGGAGVWKLTSTRGFYVERREDHISTVLFHIWAAFPNSSWVAPLLDLWGITHGHVTRAHWSYSWEQRIEGKLAIADIVLCWEDEVGQGILVVEAKRPGGKLTGKDVDGGSRYLSMPSIRPFSRKHVGFLLDDRSVPVAQAILPLGTPVATWQDMGRLQANLLGSLVIPGTTRDLLRSTVAKHYSDLGLGFDLEGSRGLDRTQFTGRGDRYEAVKRLSLPGSVERFLLGSEATFCSRNGQMPEPPFPWLAEEPSFIDVVQRRQQTTEERGRPLWRLLA